MKFKDFVKQCEKLLKEHPETAELEVFQMSCFDRPLTFETDGVYVEDVHTIADSESFISQEEAEERANEDGVDVSTIETHKAIMITAI